jgi:ribosome-binding factor A
MMAGPRNAKVGDRIKVVVAQMLERRVKDPRLGDETQRQETAAALRSATGLIRSEVGKQLGTRITPSVTFFLDSVPETAKEIEELLAKVKASDDEVANRTVGAQYAGDPDPYKKPVADEDVDDE